MTEPEPADHPNLWLLRERFKKWAHELEKAERTQKPSSTQGMRIAVSYTRSRMKRWLMSKMFNEPERWLQNLRVSDALLTGIQDGSFPLNSHDDVLLLRSITFADLSFLPFVVEHYIDTGELAALFDEIELHTPIETLLTGAAYFADSSAGSYAGFRVKMLRLYSFDYAQQRGLDNNVDSAGQHRLPLDVRMHLCGIYDEVSVEDAQWDYEMRTSGGYLAGTEGEILASFEEMTARQQPEPPQ